MKSRRISLFAHAAVATAALALLARPGTAQAQFNITVGNVGVKLTIPAGVTKMQGVLAFTARGLASGWAGSADFAALAKRINAGIAVVSGGDDLNDGSYPGRCKSGEFNNVPMAFEKLATMASHPELAHIPLVGLGHSHGGDYWNWFNACHPDRMAMVFVHASGGVNYSAGALKVPVFYTLGTADLIENGSKKPRAGMFVNRAKGAPMTMVIGEGGHDTQFSAGEYQIVTALIEAIFKMRVPADADSAKGPVQLNDIVEGANTWVGDLYTKEISTWADFKGNKALTAFLPNEQLAMMWKTNGPGLPTSVMLPSDTCGWCGKPNDEPAAVPGAPVAMPPPSTSTDGGTPPAQDDASTPPPPAEDAAPPTSDPGTGGSNQPPTTPEPPKKDAGAPPTTGSGGSSGGGSSNSGGSSGSNDTSGSSPSGGCTFAPTQTGGTSALLFGALALVGLIVRRRR